MAEWAELEDELVTIVGAMPPELAERYIRYATVALCEHAPVWQYDYMGSIAPRAGGVESIPLIQTPADAIEVMTSYGYNPQRPDDGAWASALPSHWRLPTRETPIHQQTVFRAGVVGVNDVGDPLGAITADLFTISNTSGIFEARSASEFAYLLMAVPAVAQDLTEFLSGRLLLDQSSAFQQAPNNVEIDGVEYKVWRSIHPWHLRGAQRFQAKPVEAGEGVASAAVIAGYQPVRRRDQALGRVTADLFSRSSTTGVLSMPPQRAYYLFGVPVENQDITSIQSGPDGHEQQHIAAYSRLGSTVEVDGKQYKVWYSTAPLDPRGVERYVISPVVSVDEGSYVEQFLAKAAVPATIHGVEWLRVNDDEWEKASIKTLNLINSRDGTGRLVGSFRYGQRAFSYQPPTADKGGRVWFAPRVDDQNVDYTVTLVLKPSVTDRTLDDRAAYLLTEYRETILAGAAYRMLSMAKEPWTNQRAASVQYDMWKQGLAEAALRASGRRNAGMQQTQYGGIISSMNTPGRSWRRGIGSYRGSTW